MPESNSIADAYSAAPKLLEIREDLLFGDVWEREQLSKRDRSLITVASLMSQHVDAGPHIARALENGVTRDEIAEVIVHIALYAGWPAGVNGSVSAGAVYRAQAER